ncbi:MAG: hypothetical protein LUF26_01620 [Firmicutes bacterium]|nr:hypothetical protein [Bacillota bacterium]
MAEKYGEVPKRFTKKWWDYFWYYYKWHTIITVIAVIVAAVTIVQCATREKYDMTVVYAGHMSYSETETEKLRDILSQYVTDIDGNGKQSVYFQTMMFSDGAGNEEYDYAIQTKLDLSFTDDYTYIYLMDEVEAALYLQRESVADSFVNTDVYAADTDAEILLGSDGEGYAVNLKDSAVLKENSIYCDDLYLLIRQNYSDGEKDVQSYEDALKIAEILIQ